MKTGYKIAIIVILFLAIIGLLVFSILPLAKNNEILVLNIAESTKNKTDFESNIKSLLEVRSRYYVLNALLDKYNTQVPLNANIPNLTDQIYEIEKYSGIKIESVNYKDMNVQNENKEKSLISNIIVDLNITGSYYQILTFINTLEIMPRFIKIEKISTKIYQTQDTGSTSAGGLNQIMLTSLISFRTFYDKTDYNK